MISTKADKWQRSNGELKNYTCETDQGIMDVELRRGCGSAAKPP